MIRAARPPLEALDPALAAAALVLAVSSRGEMLVLAALLAPAVRRPASVAAAVGLAGAALASSARWGTTSLDALAGAQSVLGPAGGVGPAWGAAGSWLAAGAILLAGGRGPHPVRWLATGAAVAAVLAGPGPGGELPVRVAVGVGGSVAAGALAAWRGHDPRVSTALAWAAGLAGLAAVVAVLVAGIPAAPELDADLVGQGAAIAAAVALGWLVVDHGWAAWRPAGAVA